MSICDILQALCWGFTYVLIIIFGIINFHQRKKLIPYIAVVLNFSWEINALVLSRGMWTHFLWAFLDAVIVVLSLLFIKQFKSKFLFLISIFFMTLILFFLMRVVNGMLVTCFNITCIKTFFI